MLVSNDNVFLKTSIFFEKIETRNSLLPMGTTAGVVFNNDSHKFYRCYGLPNINIISIDIFKNKFYVISPYVNLRTSYTINSARTLN